MVVALRKAVVGRSERIGTIFNHHPTGRSRASSKSFFTGGSYVCLCLGDRTRQGDWLVKAT